MTTYVNPNIPYPEFGKFESIWTDTRLIDDLVTSATSMTTGAIFKHSHNIEANHEMNSVFASKSNDKGYLINLMYSYSESDMSISNAGTYVFNKKQPTPSAPFRIEETFFTDSICNTRTCLLGALNYHISYWNGKLMIALCSNRAAIGSGFTERLVQLFKNNLEKSVGKLD